MKTTAEREAARLRVTRSYPVAERGMEAALSEACRLAALLCHRPMAAVELVLADMVMLAATAGLKAGRIARSEALGTEFLEERRVIVVRDARMDARFRGRRLVADPKGVRFYAAVPLVSPEGYALGVLSVWDHESGDLLPSQAESLEALGRMVMAQLDLGRRQRQLEELEADHERVEAALREAEAKYRGIVENTVLGIYQTTPEGRYLSANPMLASIYGYESPSELMEAVGNIQIDIYVDPTARDRFKAALQQQDMISNFEAQIRRKDGKVIWIAETARVVRGESGQLLFYEGTVQDITDRKEAEERLRNSEMLYHSLVEELPQNIFRKDRSERFIFANSRFCETVGRPLERVLGLTDFDLFPSELARKYQADDQRVMSQGQTLRLTECNVTPDGEEHWVEVVKTPLRDVNGVVTGIQGIFWDVTQHKRLQDALAYERDLLQALLDHSPDVIYFKDPSSRFVKAGRSAARWFDVPDSEGLVGKTLFDILPVERARELQEEEQEMLRSGRPIINQVLDYGELLGRASWASVTKIPIYDRSGQTLGLVVVARDITPLIEAEQALREAEERFRGIFENSVEGIYQTTLDGRFLRANPALARIYGYASPDEVVASLTDVRDQVYVQPGRRDEFVRAVMGSGSITGFESEIFRKDGSTTWVSESARIVRDREGKPAYFEGSVEDISARRQIDAERERARQEAIESARLKAEFVATVSHEIRTPLNAILPNTDLLLQSRLDRQTRYLVENIDHGARMLLQIVNDILDFSKIEAGAIRLEEIDFDLHELVERTVSFFAGRALEKHLELIGEVGAGVPRQVRGDPSRLEQVLNNLIANAIKFTAEGEVHVTVERSPGDPGTTELMFRVRDTGIGIAPEARPRVFQAFAQADGSMSRRYGGTGLGLAITRRFVELMGGRIDFDSEVGQGTTFWFTTRLRDAHQARPVPPPAPILSGRRVLVVDDNAAQRAAMVACLSALDPARIEAASTIAEAVEILRNAAAHDRRFDLVLFDADLPGGDGRQTAHRLRLGGAFGDLVALTPPGRLTFERSLEAAGVRGTLVKPLRPTRISEELASLFSGDAESSGTAAVPVGEPPLQVGAGLRVLVVDDNDMNHRVVRGMLERFGARTEAVSSGAEALAIVARESFDLVLMDCQMPDMDGYETTRRLREWEAGRDRGRGEGGRRRIPIVAVSANALDGDREKGLKAGMDDYLTKPLRLPDLARVLGAAVGRPATEPHGGEPSPGPGIPSAERTEAEEGDPVLDPTPLESLRSPDEPEALAGFVDQFIGEAPTRLDRLQAAADVGDATRLRAEAHSLKGNASYMGARRLVAACQALEEAARNGELSQSATMVAAVRTEFVAARQALKRYLEETGANA